MLGYFGLLSSWVVTTGIVSNQVWVTTIATPINRLGYPYDNEPPSKP